MSNNRSDDSGGERGPGSLVAAVAGVAAVVGGLYWWSRSSDTAQKQPHSTQKQPHNTQKKSNLVGQERASAAPRAEECTARTSVTTSLADLLSRVASSSSSMSGPRTEFRQQAPPAAPLLSNLNALLQDIYVRYVQIKDKDFELHYRVFNEIFQHLHAKMKDVDPYYRKYSSTVYFAGSHYDNLRIKKPDEFDMDIVVGLPLSMSQHADPGRSDVVIEPKSAGFVQLRMGVQFQRLPMRDGIEWQNNKAAYEWMDSSNYLLRSKFLEWFKGVVERALNTCRGAGGRPQCTVGAHTYFIRTSDSGPAATLIIENYETRFRLDVDLVPALRFPESRWPLGPAYRAMPGTAPGRDRYFLLVGKPIKVGVVHDKQRSWRLALHHLERDLMHHSGNLKQALRLIKKLRDAQNMNKIASYYVKTVFFWEIERQNNVAFWQRNSPAFLFKHMVGRLHEALVNKKIPYYWNKNNNLLQHIDERTLCSYAAKLVPLMQVLEEPSAFKRVAKYLLTPDEYREYNAKYLHL